ncbi:cupredoxin domain-containing protein [Nitrosopumilus sp.]|uniref:cupredoxin domain-containing protein n=1 Tax=Nitrosopumilus sp. TaxID=2024843 RepID=UPI003B5CF95A
MAGIDKAAIAFSIAITAIGAGIAFAGDSMEFSTPVSTPNAPMVSTETSESEPKSDPFADLAQKVKDEAANTGETMEEAAEVVEETMEEAAEVVEEIMAGPQKHTVDMPKGTSVPGCEETNECYLPADITINVGDTVAWVNVDTAAHTVTSGSPADGPSGVFDSSLVMADAVYAFTFEEAGTYDYFCMVHPWMVGSVTVTETVMEEAAEVVEETMEEAAEVVEEIMAGPQKHTVDMPKGTSVPGCEETNECYLPADITINVGDTVAWVNVDTAAHTVTSGSPADGPSGVFDSSLVMADAVYAFTFEEAGTYDYFCMVHPWMVGSVTVN